MWQGDARWTRVLAALLLSGCATASFGSGLVLHAVRAVERREAADPRQAAKEREAQQRAEREARFAARRAEKEKEREAARPARAQERGDIAAAVEADSDAEDAERLGKEERDRQSQENMAAADAKCLPGTTCPTAETMISEGAPGEKARSTRPASARPPKRANDRKDRINLRTGSVQENAKGTVSESTAAKGPAESEDHCENADMWPAWSHQFVEANRGVRSVKAWLGSHADIHIEVTPAWAARPKAYREDAVDKAVKMFGGHLLTNHGMSNAFDAVLISFKLNGRTIAKKTLLGITVD